MTTSNAPSSEFMDLMGLLTENRISPHEAERLEQILWANPECRKHYVDYMLLVSGLYRTRRVGEVPSDVQETTLEGLTARLREASPAPLPPVVFSQSLNGSASFLTSGWPVAYLIATVCLAIGLTIASFVSVSLPESAEQHFVLNSGDAPALLKDRSNVVGWITGAVDCEWADVAGANQQNTVSSPLRVGDVFALRSGLLEITYDAGAKVILQGPVTYEVESVAGGYLSVGKLTAKLEKNDEKTMSEDRAVSRASLSPASLFSIRTPTALVTDLGTEFGVEVDRNGDTQSHVFRGSVRVQVIAANGKPVATGRVLHQDESIRVDRASSGDTPRMTTVQVVGKSVFVREIPKPVIKRFDLADLVAGGDGHSNRRGRGICPVNGQATDSALGSPKNTDANDVGRFRLTSDGKYHRVEASPLIDGVFIPYSRPDGVQVDSAGHRFSEFTTVCNTTAGNVWAGGTIPVLSSSMPPTIAARLPFVPPSQTLVPTKLKSVDFATPPHALIFLSANAGVTFDLEAIRRANPGCRLLRFLATAGNTEIASEDGLAVVYADLWVLVDGQVRFRRREINKCSGEFSISLPIGEKDRFLTLMATDGGNDIGFDWILFGDPVLEFSTAVSERQVTSQSK
jgi:hypothetical protein